MFSYVLNNERMVVIILGIIFRLVAVTMEFITKSPMDIMPASKMLLIIVKILESSMVAVGGADNNRSLISLHIYHLCPPTPISKPAMRRTPKTRARAPPRPPTLCFTSFSEASTWKTLYHGNTS